MNTTDLTPEERAFLDQASEVLQWMVSRVRPGRPIGLNTTWSRGTTIFPELFRLDGEAPRAAWDLHGTSPFEAGMVFVVAPTIVSESFGRITLEQTVRVTASQPEILTATPQISWEH